MHPDKFEQKTNGNEKDKNCEKCERRENNLIFMILYRSGETIDNSMQIKALPYKNLAIIYLSSTTFKIKKTRNRFKYTQPDKITHAPFTHNQH